MLYGDALTALLILYYHKITRVIIALLTAVEILMNVHSLSAFYAKDKS